MVHYRNELQAENKMKWYKAWSGSNLLNRDTKNDWMYVEFYIFSMFARGKDLHFECSRDICELLYDYEGL